MRDQILTRLRERAPALVTLTEPDAERDQLPVTARVHEALAHDGVLAALVPGRRPARRVLEEQYFGREIGDVVGFDRMHRWSASTHQVRRGVLCDVCSSAVTPRVGATAQSRSGLSAGTGGSSAGGGQWRCLPSVAGRRRAPPGGRCRERGHDVHGPVLS